MKLLSMERAVPSFPHPEAGLRARFVTRAVDEKAHCGYQEWHRKVDAEVLAWLKRYYKATPKEFEAYLREVYSRPDMLKRFPHGF